MYTHEQWLATMISAAERNEFTVETSANEKGTVAIVATKGGWVLRTWSFASKTGTRMVNLAAPEGFAFTDSARAAFGARKSKRAGLMVHMTGREADCFSQWVKALKVPDAPGTLRPLAPEESAAARTSKAWGPKRAAVAAMLASVLDAIGLDCVTDELVSEARAVVKACVSPTA